MVFGIGNVGVFPRSDFADTDPDADDNPEANSFAHTHTNTNTDSNPEANSHAFAHTDSNASAGIDSYGAREEHRNRGKRRDDQYFDADREFNRKLFASDTRHGQRGDESGKRDHRSGWLDTPGSSRKFDQ
jgi:hypothetical protein